MANYEIMQTPGREIVAPKEGEPPIRNQDEAKIIVSRLRAEDKIEGRVGLDYVMVPIKAPPSANSRTSGGGTASSIRISDENRAKLARRVGRIMMETGTTPSMGDVVADLVDMAEEVAPLLTPEGKLDPDLAIAYAKTIIAERKRAAAQAAATPPEDEEGAA